MTAMPHWPLYLGPNKDLTNSVSKVLFILNLLDNPQDKLQGVIHITGTNGKGSTANYIYNILRSHGFNVNLYTSPHIYQCNERIVMNGGQISDENLYFYFEKLRLICEQHDIEPTLFEATTIVGFMAFADTNADFNVIEVGMGGKNDATNVFKKSLAVFTPIHVDHARFLGNTPIQNALQKIGIVKQNSVIVSAPQTKEVQDFILNFGDHKVYLYDRDYKVVKIEDDEQKIVFEFGENLMLLDKPKLLGDHQLTNMAVAIMVVIACDIDIFVDKINDGIANTYWPVRMEPVKFDILPSKSEVFMDGAHNVSGAFAVANFLKQYQNTHKLYIINGRTKNTDSYGFLQQFVGVTDGIMTVRVQLEALPEAPEVIVAEGLKLGLKIQKTDNILDAIQKIADDCNNEPCVVVICGSLYLARDVRFLLQHID
jgi:dihydrofolate synthase/folylpolyglutamate synthase